MRMKNWVCAAGLVLGGVGGGGLAAGQSHDYVFTIDPDQSNLTFEINVLSKSQYDSSAVMGTVKATLTPVNGVFSSIQITDIVADLVNTDLYFYYNYFLFSGTIHIYNAGLRMGDGYGHAGSAVSVSGGSFTQTGNQVQGLGSIHYSFTMTDPGVVDLGSQVPSAADFAGTVIDDGNMVSLTVPIHLTYLNVDGKNFVNAYIDGQIVATASTYILTCEGQGKYYPADINEDCYVDIQDLALFIQNWLDCNDPDNQDCF